jgi:photosystem II stability/assembly factor-like uncharacterized protein
MDLISPYYMDICKTSDNKTYICGSPGVVYFSDNRGQTWSIGKTDSYGIFLSISALGNSAITVGYFGEISFTLDGGTKWNKPQKITSQKLNSVVLIDENIGVAFGDNGTIIKTTDSGRNWNQIQSEILSNILYALVTESKKIIIATSDGNIYKSFDFGDSWSKVTIPVGFANPRKFAYSLDKIIYLLTDNKILKSTDEGETWHFFNNPNRKYDFIYFTRDGNGYIGGSQFNTKLVRVKNDTIVVDTINITAKFDEVLDTPIKGLVFFDESEGLAFGTYNFISKTYNKGDSWDLISYFNTYGSDMPLSSIFFLNDSVGFVGTKNEILYKTTNRGITWDYIKKDSLRDCFSSILSIFFFDENVGMLNSYEWDGTLLKTYDGGRTVKRDTVSRQLNGATFDFNFIHDSTFLFIGWRWFDNVWHTYYGLREFNGSWLNKGVFDSCQLASRYFLRNKIFLSGYFIDSCKLPEEPYMYYRGLIVKSEDNCKTWKKTFFDTIDVIRSVEFVDDSLGYAFSNSYINGKEDSTIVFRTTDGGESWHFFSNDTNIIRKIAILRNHNGKYAIGYGKNKKYLFTTDYGATWSPLPISTSYTIMGIYATDNYFYLKGICGTYNIMIRIKLKDEYISVKEETQSLPAPLAYMSLPYPNPANEYTNFDIVWDKRYDINENSFSITNVFGQKFDNTKLEILGRNDNRATIRWNTNGIPAGLYIFKLELDGYQRVQKVVLNK